LGWDKNTIVQTAVDFTLGILKRMDIPHTITTLGHVSGQGMNDSYSDSGNYSIRRLEYHGKVLLERMERSYDCDADDYLVSQEFPKGQEPRLWPIVQYTHDAEYCDGSNKCCSCVARN